MLILPTSLSQHRRTPKLEHATLGLSRVFLMLYRMDSRLSSSQRWFPERRNNTMLVTLISRLRIPRNSLSSANASKTLRTKISSSVEHTMLMLLSVSSSNTNRQACFAGKICFMSPQRKPSWSSTPRTPSTPSKSFLQTKCTIFVKQWVKIGTPSET